ncbi:MAG TPA: penicillin-binding transpeptidase domain-containing protein [Desulfitobacterium sp.]|nr:penicillin-binding transpeptidase domain-containing protein [Desulfitobacterium sp.]
MGQTVKTPKKRSRFKGYFRREKVVYLFLVVLILVVVGKLFSLQVVQASNLKAVGIERRTQDQSLQPERGQILDAQGHVLAQSVPVKEVYADPRTLNTLISDGKNYNKEDISIKLGDILGLKSADILNKLNQDLASVSLAHQVELTKVDQIQALKIPGVGFNDEQKRAYPMDTLASAVLGIVNLSGHGAEGLEYYYDKELYGTPGYASQQQDSGLSSVLETLHNTQTPQKGADLTLTLDSTIQYLVEQQLDDLAKTTHANRISILAMDPMTGKVLAMGSRPNFNPNDYNKTDPENRKNLNISMSYEPGSTFKIITGSAALEEGAITPDSKFEDPGYYKVGTRVITNWDSDQTVHGWLDFTQGMELSDNVVLSQVGTKLGIPPFYTYLKAFGFGSKTGIDIAGEESGLLVPQNQARTIDLATMSFGQANLVTPIQLLSAISAVANGGTLNKPYVVDKIVYPDGTVQQNKPVPIRKVISKTTADQMTGILEKVVNQGTGHLAQIPGIRVAGKTGTAQKVDSKTGQYSTTDFIASFTAFAPADDPKIAVLITIDTPRGDSHQGGTLGGPIARAIIEGALQHYGIPVAKETQSAVSTLPAGSFTRPAPQPVTPVRQPLEGETIVPDLTGLTLRQAGDTLAKSELHFNFSGTGLAQSQTPAPGQVVNKGSTVEIKFSPLNDLTNPMQGESSP